MPQGGGKYSTEDCVTAGCDGGDPESEKQQIKKELDSSLRKIPYLLDLLAQMDPEEARNYSSSLMGVLAQPEADRIITENLRQQKPSKRQY